MQQAFENRCQMQLKDMAHKQQLYFERRKNIVLHRDTMKEINKIKSLQKAISIHENAEKQEEEEEMWKYQVMLHDEVPKLLQPARFCAPL